MADEERFDASNRFDVDAVHLLGEDRRIGPGRRETVLALRGVGDQRRVAIDQLAFARRLASAWAASIYAKAKARGCDHPHAIRILSRAWLRVIWRAWIDRTPYDPALHGGANALLKTAEG